MPRKSYFKSSAGLKRSSTILNCRKVARNQGIGMCRNSKRSDQSVGEKEGGLASSMLKARSQDRQTSWFDPCDSCRAAVRLAPSRRPGVPSACSDAAVHGRALEWASWQFKETLPSQRPTRHCLRTSGNVRPCSFILFPTALAVAVGGNQRHENGTAWFWQSCSRELHLASKISAILAHLGRKPSAKPDAAKLGAPGPAQPSARSRAVSGRLPRNQGAVAGQ